MSTLLAFLRNFNSWLASSKTETQQKKSEDYRVNRKLGRIVLVSRQIMVGNYCKNTLRDGEKQFNNLNRISKKLVRWISMIKPRYPALPLPTNLFLSTGVSKLN